MLDRVGLYHWAGPGTIRINDTKYFNAKHDYVSLMNAYKKSYLARAQELFGLTDIWVTYSWGYSEATEAEDYDFILRHLDGMKELGLTVHAYIQGPNLVYEDFPGRDWWARDERGRTITYYRGRRVCSIHHPEFRQYVVDKVNKMHGLGFDGVFMDNIQQGQLGIPLPKGVAPFVFCGDASPVAQKDFFEATGEHIPDDFEADPELTQRYLDFRVDTNVEFVTEVSEAVHAGGMQFGTNFYDPKFDVRYTYGLDIARMAAVQDYILFENHALPTSDGRKNNGYIEDLITELDIQVPTFIVSYAEGVGLEPQYTQEKLDNLFSEAAHSKFYPCIKGGEYTTKGVWHSLYLDNIQKPDTTKNLPQHPYTQDSDLIKIILQIKLLRTMIKRLFNPVYTAAFETRALRLLVYIVYLTTLK